MIHRFTLSMLLILFMGHVAPAHANPDIDFMKKIERAFTAIAKGVKPTVVSIRVERKKRTAQQKPRSPHPNMPQFSSGSGVIIDPAGYILTNNHVISNARRLRVRLSDESEYWGKVVGTDRYTDLALVKINANYPLPAATLGDSDKVKVGQWSIAVGDPFGIARTFTVGVVSGIGRSGVGIARYEHFIQTDAAINRGNSGGPLVNIDGEVIGINTAIPAPGSGIGFAIPVNMAKDVVKYLRRSGNFPRGYLGVTIQPVSRDIAYLLGLPKAKGGARGFIAQRRAGGGSGHPDGRRHRPPRRRERGGYVPPSAARGLDAAGRGRSSGGDARRPDEKISRSIWSVCPSRKRQVCRQGTAKPMNPRTRKVTAWRWRISPLS